MCKLRQQYHCKNCHGIQQLEKQVAQLSQRDRATGWVSFCPKVEDWNWETILCGHYGSIFNHCGVIGQQSYRIW